MHENKHYMRPCNIGDLLGRHAIIYVREREHKGMIVPQLRHAWRMDFMGTAWSVDMAGSWSNTDQLDDVLEKVCKKSGETTLWLLRGWTDMVLSGIVELIDAGIITWRYVSLSGRSCLIKGAWRGRKITITSLTNWTGSRWDGWSDVATDASVARLMTAVPDISKFGDSVAREQQLRSLQTIAAIASCCSMLRLKRIPPTSGAAGLLLWRSWLGPRVTFQPKKKAKSPRKKPGASTEYVAPIPSRPTRAANAERHTCYGLASRQLRTGLVDGPIYVMDLRSAYLVGLSMTPLPLIYERSLYHPKVGELTLRMKERTGCALVRIHTDDWYYPCRVNGSVVQCRGRFWTWLAGAELVHALARDHIAECWSAYIWHACITSDEERMLLDMIKSSCERSNMPAVCSAWRSIYSSLVGRFAGWERVWKDSPAHAGFGRWSQWLQADRETGVVVPHRSIGGKVQYLAEKRDRHDSVPLMFGCVTSMVRWLMSTIVNICGYDHVYAMTTDSIWLDTAGLQIVQRQISKAGLAPDNVRVKAIYDKAWMTGRHVAVTERHGVRQLHMPGVSMGAALDSDGRVVVEHTDDWDSDGEPRANRGIRRRKHRYSIERVLRDYGFPARILLPGETVNIPLLSDTLLQRLKGERTLEDA